MHPYLLPLQKEFIRHANAESAAWTKAYMKGQFEYFGLDAKIWRQVSKDHFRQHGLPAKKEWKKLVKELFSLPQREFHYFAVEMLGAAKKEWDETIIDLIEHCLNQDSQELQDLQDGGILCVNTVYNR